MTGDSDVDSSATRPSLPEEMAQTTKADWVMATLKSAGIYLAGIAVYLGFAVGVMEALKSLFDFGDQESGIAMWVIALVVALPVLFTFCFNLLPILRRRREREARPVGRGDPGYFVTGPREDDQYQLFSEGYDSFLQWASTPQASLLHLSGLSGSGKSSLLNAYLRPHLNTLPSGPTTLITIRSYNDPLAALKETLLGYWKSKPSDYADLSPFEAVTRAARQLNKEESLLIAFDQFEEFFILRATGPKGSDSSSEDLDPEVVALQNFLHAILDNPPPRVTVLLSYRDDHHCLLAPLRLPGRKEGENWMVVDPLDFSAAGEFLRKCPGLSVPNQRMERVLTEAARQEQGRVVMRPIVANLLGIILQRMSNHPTLWKRNEDLLRGYVSDCLGDELKEERSSILRMLITDFHTARPRNVATLAAESRHDVAKLEGDLQHLDRAGLLRCINPDETDPAFRVWQISHDFIATLVERVLDGIYRTWWRSLRPFFAPLLLVTMTVLTATYWAIPQPQTVQYTLRAQNDASSPPRKFVTTGFEIASTTEDCKISTTISDGYYIDKVVVEFSRWQDRCGARIMVVMADGSVDELDPVTFERDGPETVIVDTPIHDPLAPFLQQ